MSTELGVAVAVVALVILEAWTIRNDRPHDTISEVIRRGARRYMIVAFTAGVLCGHWFWPLVTEDECRASFPCPSPAVPARYSRPSMAAAVEHGPDEAVVCIVVPRITAYRLNALLEADRPRRSTPQSQVFHAEAGR